MECRIYFGVRWLDTALYNIGRQAVRFESGVELAWSMLPQSKVVEVTDWPHAPIHRLSEAGAYMVTAGTYKKEHFFNSPDRLSLVSDLLFKVCIEFDWKLQAWAVMSNHYHFVCLSTENPEGLKKLVSKLHTLSAKEINKQDQMPGRKVWFQYWDSIITFERSYFARLKYVHQNPVYHGIVGMADKYEWCSAKWFHNKAKTSFIKTVESFKTDRIKVLDDF